MYTLDSGGFAPEYFRFAASQLDRYVADQGIDFAHPLPEDQFIALDTYITELDDGNPYSGDIFYARAHNHHAQPGGLEDHQYVLFGGLVIGRVDQLVGISYTHNPTNPQPVFGLTVELTVPEVKELEIEEPVQILTPIKSAKFDLMMPWSQLN